MAMQRGNTEIQDVCQDLDRKFNIQCDYLSQEECSIHIPNPQIY